MENMTSVPDQQEKNEEPEEQVSDEQSSSSSEQEEESSDDEQVEEDRGARPAAPNYDYIDKIAEQYGTSKKKAINNNYDEKKA